MATAAKPQLEFAEHTSPPTSFSESPEFDLMLACCANKPDHIRALLGCPVDWDRLLHLVDHHRVLPQVYSALSAFSRSIPVPALDVLRSRYKENARKALCFAGELLRIAAHLESAGIKA